MNAVGAAVSVLVAFALAGCASEQVSTGSSPTASTPAPLDASMTGRWILSAPNAPSCGMEFRGPVGARNGAISPDGGCPANFYMSRRWAMEGSVLTIADEENQPLAELRPGSSRFEGQSTGGTPVTLGR